MAENSGPQLPGAPPAHPAPSASTAACVSNPLASPLPAVLAGAVPGSTSKLSQSFSIGRRKLGQVTGLDAAPNMPAKRAAHTPMAHGASPTGGVGACPGLSSNPGLHAPTSLCSTATPPNRRPRRAAGVSPLPTTANALPHDATAPTSRPGQPGAPLSYPLQLRLGEKALSAISPFVAFAENLTPLPGSSAGGSSYLADGLSSCSLRFPTSGVPFSPRIDPPPSVQPAQRAVGGAAASRFAATVAAAAGTADDTASAPGPSDAPARSTVGVAPRLAEHRAPSASTESGQGHHHLDQPVGGAPNAGSSSGGVVLAAAHGGVSPLPVAGEASMGEHRQVTRSGGRRSGGRASGGESGRGSGGEASAAAADAAGTRAEAIAAAAERDRAAAVQKKASRKLKMPADGGVPGSAVRSTPAAGANAHARALTQSAHGGGSFAMFTPLPPNLDDNSLFDSIDVESFADPDGPLSRSAFPMGNSLYVMNGGVDDVPGSIPQATPAAGVFPPGSTKFKPSKSRGGRPGKCSCRQSKCIKLYCDCFSVQKYCDDCNCKDCENYEGNAAVDEARKSVIRRQPKAFEKKFVTADGDKAIEVKEKSGAKHARGCNCAKSKCMKNYCECFQMNIGCNPKCKCVGCKNPMGERHDHDEYGMEDETAPTLGDHDHMSTADLGLGPLDGESAIASSSHELLNQLDLAVGGLLLPTLSRIPSLEQGGSHDNDSLLVDDLFSHRASTGSASSTGAIPPATLLTMSPAVVPSQLAAPQQAGVAVTIVPAVHHLPSSAVVPVPVHAAAVAEVQPAPPPEPEDEDAWLRCDETLEDPPLRQPRFSLGGADAPTLLADDGDTGTGGAFSGRPSLPSERGTTSAAPVSYSPEATGGQLDLADAKATAMDAAGSEQPALPRGFKWKAPAELDEDFQSKKRPKTSHGDVPTAVGAVDAPSLR